MMRSTAVRTAVIAILVLGGALRSVQFGSRASMSSDEVALALNVTDRGWNELLFRPLMYEQVAPVGFLFLEKVGVAIGGNTEAAFRFLPYLISLASLLLFWRLSVRYLQPSTMLAALIVFAMSPTTVLYAGVAKQYAGDMAVTMFLLVTALRFLEGPLSSARATVLGATGGVALLLSQPAVLVAAGLGAVLVVVGWRARKPVWPLAALMVGWGIGAAVVAYTSLATYSAATSDYMDRFWRDSFVPAPWLGLAELFWIPDRLARAIIHFVAAVLNPRSLPVLALLGVYGLLLLLGILHLVKKNARTAVILAVPVIVALLAAAVRLLPLSGRISLFIGPSLLIGCFAGFDRLRRWVPARFGVLVPAAALGLAALPAFALLAHKPVPVVLSGTRPVMEDVKAHWLPGDELAVSKGRWTAISVEYYTRRVGIPEWTPIDRISGRHTAEQILRGYLHGLDAFRGRPRAWLYLEGTVPCEDEAMAGYLSAIGRRIHSATFQVNQATRISAYLYDLSDPQRLSRTNAETYPVPECSE